MRLTCPNCGAQYEVPDDVIPTDGRDVQCSNCGTTWFQPHKDAMPADTAEPDPTELRSALEDLGETVPEPETEPEMPDQMPTASEPPRRELDPEVQDILQEEAAHETRLRSEESTSLETQPDLGLDDTADDAERRAREARTRMERLKGPEDADEAEPEPNIEEAVAAAAAAAQSSRRDRLPDIDEINSSLRQTNSPAGAQDDVEEIEEPAPQRSGFARGFAIPLIIVSLLVLLYIMAPMIADAVPALGPAVNSYVLTVDNLRSWLNAQIDAFMP